MSNTIGSTDRNYSGWVNGGESTSTANSVYNAVFSNKDNSAIEVSDFLQLMITQMTNQDFTNPADDTQYLTQMAQFATMSQMTELAEYSKQNYLMSLLGKEATVSKYTIGGGATSDTGTISSVSLVSGEYTVTVNDKTYTLDQIMQLHSGASSDSTTKPDEETDDTEQEASDVE